MSDETKPPAKPVIGLPPGIDAEAVTKRRDQMVSCGSNPLIAEKLAIDAEILQTAHNARKKKQADDAKAASAKKGGAK